MLWNIITALANQQHGLVSRRQVLEAGGTDAWLKWAVLDGRLQCVRRGIYAVPGASSPHQALMAACLAAGPSAAASHFAAAALWGAEQIKPGAIEVTTFDNRLSRLPGMKSHRSRLPAELATTRRFDIPVVQPALTVVQLADTCHPRLVTSVANDLVKHNWTTFPRILAWSNRAGGQSDGQQALKKLCQQAVDLGGHATSPAARDLGSRLRAAGAGGFTMEYPVETPGGLVLIDFAWPEPKLGLEYNGARDHDSLLAKGADARRRSLLAALGWRMIEANAATPLTDVVDWVLAALAATPFTSADSARHRELG